MKSLGGARELSFISKLEKNVRFLNNMVKVVSNKRQKEMFSPFKYLNDHVLNFLIPNAKTL